MQSEDQEIVAKLHARRQCCTALGATVTHLTRVCAEHWPAIIEVNGETLARQLISQLELARRRAGCCECNQPPNRNDAP